MAKFDNFEVFIFHGPDFAGKNTFYTRELMRTHKGLHPSKMYRENQSLGFRDICLQIVKLLKEGSKIAIVDTNECKKTRLSYIKLLQRRCSDASVAVMSILPKYGCEQLFWTRELRLAEVSCQCRTTDYNASVVPLNDECLSKWYTSDSECLIQYRPGIVEAPSESEGCQLFQKSVGIYTRSIYKFEVPTMFIQWEVINGLTTNNYRMSRLSKACELWVNVNPCGRLIVICDGCQIYTGEKTRDQQQKDIAEALANFTSLFTSTPVYAFHVTDPKQAGSYVLPPKPGILAFLQQRHCLNLHSRRSVYLYETSTHMKMAENAGVRHIKGLRLLDHPSLVISSHAVSTPVIPEMLQTMKIIPGKTGAQPASKTSAQPPSKTGAEPATIPLSHLKPTLSDSIIQQNFPYGRSEYLFASNCQIIDRYEDLYMTHATQVGVPGSKMLPRKPHHAVPDNSGTSPANVSNQSALSIASRDLPKWMVKKERSDESVSSVELNQSSAAVPTKHKMRKTLYVMTDQELLEIACDVLKQAGKDEIVEKFLSKKDKNKESETGLIKTKSDHRNKTKRKTNKPGIHRTKAKHNSDTDDVRSDLCEQLGSFCPKMEPDSDAEGNSIGSSVGEGDAVSECAAVVNRNNVWEKENSKANEKETRRVTENETSKATKNGTSKARDSSEDVVASILDDFSTSYVEPKHSPRKRSRLTAEPVCSNNTSSTQRMKREPVFMCSTPSKRKCWDSASNQLHENDIKYVEETKCRTNSNANPPHEEIHKTSYNDVALQSINPKKQKTRQPPDLSHLDDIF